MQLWLTLILVLLVLLALVRCDVDRASGSILTPLHPMASLLELTHHATTLARLDLPDRAGRRGTGF